jgi:murein DD-endopeptidase MepM/ murein hydrolase activator NlpD
MNNHLYGPPLSPLPPIPVGDDHPGSFGVDRHQHVHTGVDLYAPHGAPVAAIETGRVIKIAWFTGPSINMPWWEDTRAVYIEGPSGVFNYGEIQEYPNIKVGDTIWRGEHFGYVIPVLKKYKGRPMSMLHLELYDHGYVDDWGEWKIGDPKPAHLKNPTPFLLYIKNCTLISVDPYYKCAKEFKERYL